MRKSEVVTCVQSLFSQVCEDLFVSLDCTVLPAEIGAEELADCPIACIDAGSDDIEFMIALQLPTPVLL